MKLRKKPKVKLDLKTFKDVVRMEAKPDPEAMEDLKEKLDQKEKETAAPEAWNPEQPGDTLLGTVVDIDRDAPGSHGPCDVATIVTPENEKKALWLSNKVLREAWEKKSPAPGDYVGIKFEGVKESNSGREYKLFSLVVEKNGEQDQPEDTGKEKVEEIEGTVPF